MPPVFYALLAFFFFFFPFSLFSSLFSYKMWTISRVVNILFKEYPLHKLIFFSFFFALVWRLYMDTCDIFKCAATSHSGHHIWSHHFFLSCKRNQHHQRGKIKPKGIWRDFNYSICKCKIVISLLRTVHHCPNIYRSAGARRCKVLDQFARTQ